ncbi:FimV/HubP family polar landmark protein [Limnohabitans sp. 63ED37-2]|uniref:FimV/HubP family polar landmark protein n=1 Tax=Limnohabitans sp. 63ED37-2 TaxID=1678128 RepID=UPI0018D182CE|nr:FimV/HubP family polar landmark protein [Limnohabitans sp. 63ED37-2]
MKALGALVFSAWVLPAAALDLGRLQILSGIGEPLRAEIEVAQASPEELRSLRAQLASPGAFSQAGMEFNPALNGVTASLQNRPNGTPVITLNGRAPIQENFIDLILEAQTSSGKLTKNYALLLNSVSDRLARSSSTPASANSPQLPVVPPLVQPIPPAPALARVVETPASANPLNATSVELNARNIPVYRFAPVDNTQTPRPQPSTTETSASTAALRAPAVQARPKGNEPSRETGDRSIKVRPGDTASRLAIRYLGGQASLDQMMLAMLKANPDAFIQGNVNLVKAGAVLRIPDLGEATQISRDEARKTVIAQTKEFAEYARRLAESPLLVDSKNSRSMSGTVTAEPAKPAPGALQQDKLTLSKSSVSANAADAKLASEREAKDTSDQLAALNKNLKDLEALTQNPASTNSASASNTPSAAAVSTAPATPSAQTLPTSQAPTSTMTSSSLQDLSENKQLWAWAAGLLAAILLVAFWMRRRSAEPESIYAPSYDDIPAPSTEPVMQATPSPMPVPAQMSSIDLNLQPSTAPAPMAPTPAYAAPTPVSPPPATTAAEDTEVSKLNLAAQLLAKGDKDLARALILSVISLTHGDIKARAIQMLGQIR